MLERVEEAGDAREAHQSVCVSGGEGIILCCASGRMPSNYFYPYFKNFFIHGENMDKLAVFSSCFPYIFHTFSHNFFHTHTHIYS